MDDSVIKNCIITKKDFIDEERDKFLNENIKNKTSNEITELLLNTEVKENGGIVAITGFYYQFLVAIEYLLELNEGKWDFVAIELHDDIVVGKDDKIRFIQVKTSEKQCVEATSSPANELYLRKNYEVNGKKIKVNNSWVDKLFYKAKYFKDSDNYDIEFQLAVSYYILPAKKHDFSMFIGDKGQEISDDNNLLSVLSEDVYEKVGAEYKLYKYDEQCGKSLKELLSCFSIKVYPQICDLEMFKDSICKKMERVIFKNYGEGISVGEEQLCMLIGELCSRCNVNNDISHYVIKKNDLEDIFNKVEQASLRSAQESINKYSNDKILERVFQALHNEYSGFNNYCEIEKDLYKYQEYIGNWIENNGGIKVIINRYIDGTKYSQSFHNLVSSDLDGKLKALFVMSMILNIIHGDILKFFDNQSILSKILPNNEKCLNSFLCLNPMNDFNDGISKLERIINDSTIEEQLKIVDKKLNVIFQNYDDYDFDGIKKIRIPTKVIPKAEEIKDSDSINNVFIPANIIPGDKLKKDFNRALHRNGISDVKSLVALD